MIYKNLVERKGIKQFLTERESGIFDKNEQKIDHT
jgi:hypothetical protein